MLSISGKEMIKLNLDNIEYSAQVCKAIASEVRLSILKLLVDHAMTISELATTLMLPLSTISMHTRILQQAHIITITAKPGLRGTKKLCGIAASDICLDIFEHVATKRLLVEQRVYIPIGQYVGCEVSAPCGLVSSTSFIELEDNVDSFYSTKHINAQLIWLSKGYLEYHIPNAIIRDHQLAEIEFSFEICAEAPGYNNDWPSDIGIDINGFKVATFRLKGDYGGRRGYQNPLWWGSSSTQFGEIKRLIINHKGCYINDQQVSSLKLNDLGVDRGYYLAFRIYTDESQTYIGGLNLFGKNFGDYPQDIIMKVAYANE